jgi:hypothetical protein
MTNFLIIIFGIVFVLALCHKELRRAFRGRP